MGNLISKFRRRFCRWRCHQPLPSVHRPVVFPVHCDDAPPGQAHPAAPAPVVRPGNRPSRRNRAPLSSGFYITPRRPCPLPQTTRFPVGVLPSVSWKDPPKKPVLSMRNSRMFGPARTVYIPPARRKFSLLLPPLEQGAAAEKLPAETGQRLPAETGQPLEGTSCATRCPCPKEAEVGVGAESSAQMKKNRNSVVRHNQQNQPNSPDKSGDLPLTPQSLRTKGDLRPCRPPTEEVLGEDPVPSVPASPTLGKEMDGEEPASTSACRKSRKRKRPETPPLLCDPGELPPPPKVPPVARDKDLGTLKSKKTLEDKAEGTADSSATRPAPSVCAPASGMADTLSSAPETGQSSATISAKAAADVSSQPVLHEDEDIEMDTTPPCFAATIIPSNDDDEDIEMDTTPPCYATTILSSPNCDVRSMPVYQIQYSVGHRCPAGTLPAGPH